MLETHIKNKIATINFHSPASNSLTSKQLQELTSTINELSDNNQITTIIIRSNGEKTFCAGASFDELIQIETLETGILFFSGFAHLINAMRKCKKIIIGRIQGKAVGGGVGLIAACDYTFATTTASIKLSEIAIGIGPFVIEPVVSHKTGKAAMVQLALAPTQWKNANWANTNKLFYETYETITEMDESLTTFANNLSNYNPDALIELKKTIWEGTENWDTLLIDRAKISGKLVLSEFTKKALANFKK